MWNSGTMDPFATYGSGQIGRSGLFDNLGFGSLGSGKGVLGTALNYNTAGPNGQSVMHQGWFGPALGAFGAYTNWTQGNKMYDLQKDALDFSKEQFWLNYANKIEDKNRYTNKGNASLDYANQFFNSPEGTNYAKLSNDVASQYNTGEVRMPYGAETGHSIAPVGAGSEYINPEWGNPAPNTVTNSAFAQTAPNVGATTVNPTAPSVKPTAVAANRTPNKNIFKDRNKPVGV
jgi:hypothetical protein